MQHNQKVEVKHFKVEKFRYTKTLYFVKRRQFLNLNEFVAKKKGSNGNFKCIFTTTGQASGKGTF